MKSLEQLHQITLRRGLRPIPKISVTDWANRHAIVPAGSAEPGRWKTSRVPYMRAVMDSFTQAGIERIVVKSASQVSKTSILLNVIGRFAHVDPASILVIMPTLELAQDFSKSRLSRFIDDVKPLTRLFYSAKATSSTRDPNQTILSKYYAGGRVVLAGANSPAGLASRPIRILLCDEVDRYPKSAGVEGDAVSLAAKRTTTFSTNRRIALFSTPTVEGESRIDLEYNLGTREEWRHRCPNCGEYQLLRYVDMVTEEHSADAQGNQRTFVDAVRWRCPDCGVEFDELAMKAAPQKYVAQNPEAVDSGIRSFFISGFSSPWITWRDIMQEWAEARGKPELEQVVYNTRFGESYHPPQAFDDSAQFLRRLERYGAELPRGVRLLTAAVDVQDSRLEVEIVGWGAGEESWGICKTIIWRPPNDRESWRALDLLLDRRYKFANGAELGVSRTFIDSGGHFTTAVYDYCRECYRRGKNRYAVKGFNRAGARLLHKTTLVDRYGIPLINLGVDEGKSIIFARLAIEVPGEQYMHYGLDDEYLERGYDDNYFEQLISEHKVLRRSAGIAYYVWEKIDPHARNESLDLRVYNLAAMKSMRITDWASLEEPARVETERKSRDASRSWRAVKSDEVIQSESVEQISRPVRRMRYSAAVDLWS